MAKKYKQREIEPDPIYNNILVSKFVNNVMKKGKKTKARTIVYEAFEIVKTQTKKEPLEVFEKALQNAAPTVEVRSRRVGGATYQVPQKVEEKRSTSLAMRWIIDIARNKKGKAMKEKLAQELIL
ncbi:unnamed protein product, partial [marine sediment metagenome]